MHRHHRHVDALGIVTLLGALVGFAVGAAIGLSSPTLTEPALLPFAGMAAGIALGGLIVLVPAAVHRRRDKRTRAVAHERIRATAHVDWPDGIDLASEPPPRPPRPDRFKV